MREIKKKFTILAFVASLLMALFLTACGESTSSVNPYNTFPPLPTLAPTAVPVPATPLPVYTPNQFSAANVTAAIKGGGSTFAGPIYDKWTADYKKVSPNVSVTYVYKGGPQNTGVGSGAGRSTFLGTPAASNISSFFAPPIDFVDSDAPFTSLEMITATTKVNAANVGNIQQNGAAILHIPIAVGGVAVAYHIQGVNSTLNLSGDTLAQIYLGKVQVWDDENIKRDNPTINLPHTAIKPVTRTIGTSSGTTEIFTRYLSVVSADFRTQVGPGGAPKWTINPLQGSSNAEIASQISANDGAIGYADLSDVLSLNCKNSNAAANCINFANIRNQSGRFVAPTVSSITAAAQGASIPDDFRIFIVNSQGTDAYPIAGFTWFITWRDLKNLDAASPEKAQALVKFVWWFVNEGQSDLPNGFAPLPAALVTRIDALLVSNGNNQNFKGFQYNGQPVLTTGNS